MYNEIKQNFIEKFFNKNFRYCVVSKKEALLDKIILLLPFDFYFNGNDLLTLNLGNDVNITFKLEWNATEHKNGHKVYCLNKVL